MKIKPLPPLNSLTAFEAAARHLSFTRAATELNVTQGAISRQIKQLESWLGKPLFERAHRNIALTSTGLQYQHTVHRALAEIAQASGEIRHWRGDDRITVSTTHAMAALWLLPRVADFQRQYEHIDLRILATDHVPDWNRLDCDLALFYCRRPPPGMKATPLFPEEVFPVCSPAWLAQVEWHTPQELLATKLLYLEDSQSDWVNWTEWLEAMHLGELQPRHQTRINHYPMLLQAAINGQGIALAWGGLVDDYLRSGALVRPLDQVMRTEAHFCLLEPQPHAVLPEAVRQFRGWLEAQLT